MTKPHIFVLLAVLLLGGMIVSPASAYNYMITAEPLEGTFVDIPGQVYNASVDLSPEGMAAQRIVVDIPTGTSVNFTLWYGSGASVSGWMQYNPSEDCTGWFAGEYCQYTGVAIDSDAQGYNYRGLQEIGRIDIVGYARDDSDENNPIPGFIVYDSVFGLSDRRAMADPSHATPRGSSSAGPGHRHTLIRPVYHHYCLIDTMFGIIKMMGK